MYTYIYICKQFKFKHGDLRMFEEANISVPLANLYKQAMKEGTYDFETPSDVYFVGSHLTNTQLKTWRHVSVDLAVEMSPSYFAERDYLNYRYFMKRCLYAMHIYLQLLNTKRFSKINYEFLADYSTMHKPILCMLFKGISQKKANFYAEKFVENCI